MYFRDLNSSVTFAVFASEEMRFGLIRIFGLSTHLLILGVLENIVFHTSLASDMGVTINNLLLRETQKLSSLNKVSRFNDCNSRESPARSALTLVLNWVDCS